jgi:hypothetical protein
MQNGGAGGRRLAKGEFRRRPSSLHVNIQLALVYQRYAGASAGFAPKGKPGFRLVLGSAFFTAAFRFYQIDLQNSVWHAGLAADLLKLLLKLIQIVARPGAHPNANDFGLA